MGRDLRRYARQTNFRLLIGFFIILYLLGIGLIWYFYGGIPAIFGLLCLIAGTSPILLIGLILLGMEWFVKRVNDE